MDKHLPQPAYEIPLTDEELLLVGKIGIMWAQIDEFFNQVIRITLDMPSDLFEHFLADRMIGSKKDTFKRYAKMIPNPETRKRAHHLIEKIENVLPKRNLAFHGCWGSYVVNTKPHTLRAGAFNRQKPKQRLYAYEIEQLYRDVCEISHLVTEYWRRVDEVSFETKGGAPRILFAKKEELREKEIPFQAGSLVFYVDNPPPDHS